MQTGNNNELEYVVCVKAQDKNGLAVDANTHLLTSDAKIFLDAFNYLNRWTE